MLGNAIPSQDKLRVLADWLQVSPDELRFGRPVEMVKAAEATADQAGLNMADREMLSRYMGLDVESRKTVRQVVAVISAASTIKPKN